jgi:hypothetical protein
MARIRTIKPKHVEDKELVNISLQAHLLWILMWPFSDDEGIIENDPLLIKSQVFPRRTDVRVEQVSLWLDQLVKARFIIPFDHDGIGYYIHRTFKAHQKIDKPQPSKIPSEVIRRILSEPSTNVPACIVEERKVEEGRGEEAEPPNAMVFYDAEKLILENKIWFEKICAGPGNFSTPAQAMECLKKYHLFNEEREKYPLSKKQIFAGFQRWFMNEKSFTNGNQHAKTGKGYSHKPVITGTATGAGSL